MRSMRETTTKLRLLLSNVIADSGALRDIVTSDVREELDIRYLLVEVDRLQSTAHRIVAFLDQDVIERARN
jgi:hypothetical protein